MNKTNSNKRLELPNNDERQASLKSQYIRSVARKFLNDNIELQ